MIRRMTWLAGIIAVIAAIALPATASAAVAPSNGILPGEECYMVHRPLPGCPQPVEYLVAPINYKGWTYLNLNFCARGMVCPAIYRESMVAYKWIPATAAAKGYWKQTTLKQGDVYVYPFSSPWRWAWTKEGGWVAVSGGRFEIRS